MTTYRSTTTIEAKQWSTIGRRYEAHTADEIVAWVNREGGEARYEQSQGGFYIERHPARIAVRTSTGWDYALPGWWIVKTDDWIKHNGDESWHGALSGCLAFVVVPDLSELCIAQQWEATT